jgi:c-di-GMP-binding flagellar brake protein YcgR
MERRQYKRVPYGAWVEDETGGGLDFYLALNVSMGGLLLQAKDTRPSLGSRVRLRLVIENEARVISVSGEVVRHSTESASEFAVQFNELDDTRKTFLTELLDEAEKEAE